MKNESKKEDESCASNCSDTRKQVSKIMIGFGIVVFALAYYILSENILNKAFG